MKPCSTISIRIEYSYSVTLSTPFWTCESWYLGPGLIAASRLKANSGELWASVMLTKLICIVLLTVYLSRIRRCSWGLLFRLLHRHNCDTNFFYMNVWGIAHLMNILEVHKDLRSRSSSKGWKSPQYLLTLWINDSFSKAIDFLIIVVRLHTITEYKFPVVREH